MPGGFDLGTLSVRLVTQGRQAFEADMNAVDSSVRKAAKSADDLDTKTLGAGFSVGGLSAKAAAAGTEILGMSEKSQRALTTVGGGFLAAGVAAGAFFGLAVAKSAEFDTSMSHVRAATGATTGELSALSKEARTAGADIGFSGVQAAEGITELGKAGVSTSAILHGGLKGALDLAAAGEISVADAASTASAALVQFNLRGSDVPHVADLLAAGANKALGGVSDLGYALKQSGLVASQFGLSIDETVGTLSAFASAGLLGSDAGTSFRTMLLNLATPTAQQTDLLKQYNIQAYDQQGNFVGISRLADQLANGPLKNATQAQRDYALGIIFGSDAIRAANVLYKQGGAGIDDWTRKVNDSGYAAKIAAINQDNLAGDLKKLQTAFDNALIDSGGQATGVLRDLAQAATDVIHGFSGLPPEMQQVIILGAALLAGVGLLGGGFLIAVPKIVEFRAALATLRAEMPATRAAMAGVSGFLAGPWGIALTAGLTILSLYGETQVKAGTNVKELTDSLNQQTGALTKNTREIVLQQLQQQGTYEAARKAGISIREVNDAVFKGGDALDSYNKKTSDYYAQAGVGVNIQRTFTGEASALADGVNVARKNIEDAKQAHQDLSEAQGEGTSATKANADALGGLSETAGVAQDDIQKLADAIRGFGSTQLDANSAARDFQAAIDDQVSGLAELVKAHGAAARTLDIDTEAGRQNSAALDKIAQSAIASAAAIYENTGSQEQATAAIQGGRDALISALGQFGITGQAAQDYANRLGLIPGRIDTYVAANTAPAEAAVSAFIQGVAGRVVPIKIAGQIVGGTRLSTTGGALSIVQKDGGIVRYADGGVDEGSQRIAQIARAGTYRVWAEDETGGEGYIPLSPAKRGRSESILSQIAQIFGGSYTPPGARRFADGGFSAMPMPMPVGPTGGVNVQVINKGNLRLSEIIDLRIEAWGQTQVIDLDGGYAS